MTIDYHELLDTKYLDQRSKLIERTRARPLQHGKSAEGDTVCLVAADGEGMMVSYIQSNYTGFGSGIVVPGTAISLQNRGACFSLDPDHPNRVDGGKRPFHTIIPAFVMKDGEPLMSFGLMGGLMQPQGHAQLLIRMIDYRQNPQTAIDAPRWLVGPTGEVMTEPGFGPEVLEALVSYGHAIRTPEDHWPFGGAQCIYKLPDGYCGASDPRKDGQAVGF